MKLFNVFFNFFKALGLVLVLLPNLVSGQTIAWANATTATAWYTAANWSPSTASTAWLTSNIAQFANTGTATTSGINMGTSSLSIGAIEVASTRTRVLTISNSSATSGTVTLSGATINSIPNVVLRNSSNSVLTIQNGSGTLGVVLNNVTDNIVNIDGTGGITISSIISSANKLTKAGAGAGVLTLTGANTYTGLTTVSSGTLQLNRTGGTTIPATNDVTVSGGTLKVSTNQTLNDLTVSSGTATIDNGVTLTITNTYSGLATVSSGTLRLNKTGGTTIPATNNVTVTGGTLQISTNQTLNNLIVNGGTVTVDDGVTLTINGTLTLTSGNITLGTTGTGNIIATSISGGSSTSYIVTNGAGTLTALNMAGEKTFPVGTATAYAPVKVDNSASSRDFSVKVRSTFSGSPSVPAKMVQLEWNVTPSNSVGNNAALTFEWPVGSEGGSFIRANTIEIAHFNGTIWDAFKLATLGGAGPYTATAAGFANFSPFVVGNQNALSVDLLNISAQSKGTKNVITWSTASEKNNAYFEVQHATNGLDFQPISDKIKGNGTTNVKNNYTFEHLTPSVIRDYYRLKQVDNDGTTTLSKVVSVVGTAKNGALKVYPTLASDKLTISLDSEETVGFSIYNLVGQAVQSGQLTGQKELIISYLPNGVYFFKVGNATVKFSKN